MQDEYHKIEEWKNQHFTPISEAGHGIRSMIKLLTSILDPVNQIILIDEPEMHLYTAHKRWLGRQLISLAKTQGKQVFLVTHDPLVLQGILDSHTHTTIFRIDRDKNDKGKISSCDFISIVDMNAMKNQSEFLQALFFQRCIIVEGASDRAFYQNTIEDLYTEVQEKDLGFITCGGKGNTKHMAEIVAKVGLTAAFIYDYDVILFSTSLIKDVYKILGGDEIIFQNFDNLLNNEPSIKNATDEKEKNKAIKKLCDYSDKNGINSEWAKTNISIFETLIESLSKVGIFIVPNGTLESWAPNVVPKVRFAELAPEAIETDSNLKHKFKNFSDNVLSYLKIIDPLPQVTDNE